MVSESRINIVMAGISFFLINVPCVSWIYYAGFDLVVAKYLHIIFGLVLLGLLIILGWAKSIKNLFILLGIMSSLAFLNIGLMLLVIVIKKLHGEEVFHLMIVVSLISILIGYFFHMVSDLKFTQNIQRIIKLGIISRNKNEIIFKPESMKAIFSNNVVSGKQFKFKISYVIILFIGAFILNMYLNQIIESEGGVLFLALLASIMMYGAGFLLRRAVAIIQIALNYERTYGANLILSS